MSISSDFGEKIDLMKKPVDDTALVTNKSVLKDTNGRSKTYFGKSMKELKKKQISASHGNLGIKNSNRRNS
jgi:hypothetical protein